MLKTEIVFKFFSSTFAYKTFATSAFYFFASIMPKFGMTSATKLKKSGS